MTEFTLPHMPPFIVSDFAYYSWIVISEPLMLIAILATAVVIGLMLVARRHPMERELRRMQYEELVRRANHRAMREAYVRRKSSHERKGA